MEFDKPIVLLYEGDPPVIKDMQEDYVRYCAGNSNGDDDVPTAISILKKLLGGDLRA